MQAEVIKRGHLGVFQKRTTPRYGGLNNHSKEINHDNNRGV